MAAKETPQRSGFSGATRPTPFREPPFLWVELTRDPSLLFHDLCDLYPGHRISGHEDLHLAIEKLSPSFICFEHDHPGGDGIRLLAETSARYPDVPLVMLTNDHRKETMVLAYRSGASSYVVKPIALHELVREIRMLLALGRDHAQFPAGPPATGLPSQPEGAGAGGPDHTVSRTAAGARPSRTGLRRRPPPGEFGDGLSHERFPFQPDLQERAWHVFQAVSPSIPPRTGMRISGERRDIRKRGGLGRRLQRLLVFRPCLSAPLRHDPARLPGHTLGTSLRTCARQRALVVERRTSECA